MAKLAPSLREHFWETLKVSEGWGILGIMSHWQRAILSPSRDCPTCPLKRLETMTKPPTVIIPRLGLEMQYLTKINNYTEREGRQGFFQYWLSPGPGRKCTQWPWNLSYWITRTLPISSVMSKAFKNPLEETLTGQKWNNLSTSDNNRKGLKSIKYVEIHEFIITYFWRMTGNQLYNLEKH